MKKILALTILSLTMLSCKKDKVKPTIPEPSDPGYVYVKTAGSYWVYDWYQVDSLGNETSLNSWKDTIRLVGDTMINGKNYQKFKGKDMGVNTEYYLRDSIGYIVATTGTVSYTYVGPAAFVSGYNDGYIKHDNWIGEKETISTAFGSKTAATTYSEVKMMDGSPVNTCGDLSVRFYRYYVSGIGCVQKETEYLGMMQTHCSKKVARLSAYYIAP